MVSNRHRVEGVGQSIQEPPLTAWVSLLAAKLRSRMDSSRASGIGGGGARRNADSVCYGLELERKSREILPSRWPIAAGFQISGTQGS